MAQIVISPSDYAYLYDRCKRCFWRKCHGLQPLSSGMDFRVANAYDRLIKDKLHAGEAEKLGIPYKLVRHEAIERVASEPIEFPDLGASLVIRGKTDKQFYTDDDQLVIIDAKAGDADPGKYWMQLMMYLYAIENPMEAVPREVAAIGILQWGLSKANFKLNADMSMAAISAPLRWVELPIDRVSMLRKLGDVAAIAGAAEPPEAGHYCETCKAVQQFIECDKKHSVTRGED